MAQPVFEDHPLQDYFRESGEDVDVMPGGALEFADDLSYVCSRKPRSFPAVAKLWKLICSKSHSRQHTNAFAERFRHSVISSSLLSNDLSSSPRQTSLHLPGKFASTIDVSQSLDEHSNASLTSDHTIDSNWSLIIPSMAAVAFFEDRFFLFLLLASTALVLFYVTTVDRPIKPGTMSASLDALDELITAGNLWDSAVCEAVKVLEMEERSTFHGPTSPASPSTILRIALQSSLHTTQVQCDNIRQLFSALTLASELAPLSEMYAPPSLITTSEQVVRRRSLPGVRQRTTSEPSNKRATWNGSYSALAQAGSPNMRMFKRREERRSDLLSLLGSQRNSITSVPVTPQKSLQDVSEEASEHQIQDGNPAYPVFESTFGSAALGFRRKHRSGGLDAFGHVDDPPQAWSPSSSFTLMQTSRHPLSLSALNLAFQGALAAKRYTCSHLLALRFDEEDEYWEDVRSVIALITSTIVDASSRIMEALDETEKRRIKDEIPTSDSSSAETSLDSSSPLSSLHLSPESLFVLLPAKDKKQSRTMEQSFAPMPSHLTRFAAHVDALSTALNDAWDNLEQCVASLRRPSTTTATSSSEIQFDPSLESYDRLRKELGLALRECERGREHLLEVINVDCHKKDDVPEDERADPDIPMLGHDDATDESEDPPHGPSPALFQSTPLLVPGISGEEIFLDDVTAHLLSTATARHLPPAGIEQVFEAATPADDGVTFTRKRSKLTREERIALTKTRREKAKGIGFYQHHSIMEFDENTPVERVRRGLGPGGEVVQELKDVIWKVSERKRKMAEQLSLSSSLPLEDSSHQRISGPFPRLDLA